MKVDFLKYRQCLHFRCSGICAPTSIRKLVCMRHLLFRWKHHQQFHNGATHPWYLPNQLGECCAHHYNLVGVLIGMFQWLYIHYIRAQNFCWRNFCETFFTELIFADLGVIFRQKIYSEIFPTFKPAIFSWGKRCIMKSALCSSISCKTFIWKYHYYSKLC